MAIGLGLGETKEQLKLDYEVTVKDHGTGRVTIVFSLADEGKLNPITAIKLSIPSTDKHPGGGYMSDLSLALATRNEHGKQVARIHLRRDWAERAEIHLTTRHLDGKEEPLTWYYHAIPVADHFNGEKEK